MFRLAGAPWAEYDAAATPLRAKAWGKHAWVLNMSDGGWGRPWAAANSQYDPAATLAKVKVPVLWFLGELDHNVPSASTATLLEVAKAASGNRDFTVVRIPNTGHTFLASSTGNNSEFVDRTRMAAGYWDKMESWLAQHGFSKP
jgi:pimeloyl-ACP methyl ester carboxylesterase